MGSGEVPGRLGAPMSTNVYDNAYGYEGKCTNNCTITNEGYTQCIDTSAQGAVHGGPQVGPRRDGVA